MSRPVILGFLVIVCLLFSQFEWRQQQFVNELEATQSSPEVQQPLMIKDTVREKIILSQEKNIQKLNEFVRSLQQQLRLCRDMKNSSRSEFEMLED